MAILQVHQAKALKAMHEGGTDPGLMQELRTVTDFALQAMKVTARSLGKAMSMLVVQERHLWLNLAEMRDMDKARFLDAPISQVVLFGDTVEDFAQQISDCSITEEGYKALSSALRSNPSHLIELDLTGNDPGESGVKLLSDLLQDPNCQLNTLRFLGPAADEACQYVTGIVGKNPLLLRELNLRGHKLGGDTRVNQIAALLQDKHCTLNTLILCGCSSTEKQCLILTSALNSNPSHLRELNLSWNKLLGDSGLKNLSDLLMNTQFKLEKLDLCGCSITEEQNVILTSALKSNPSHLRELNLSRNKLGDSGVKHLSDLLMNTQFKLEKLDLCGCSITEKQSIILTSALKSNPSHLRELDLSGNQIKNTGVNHLCDVLKDSHCKLERWSLNDCGITDVSSLTQSLTNTKALQFLKELNLSVNMIGDSKQKLIDVLQNSNCELSVVDKDGEDVRSMVLNILNKIAPGIGDGLQDSVDVAHCLGPKRARSITTLFPLRRISDMIWGAAKGCECLTYNKLRFSEPLSPNDRAALDKLWPLLKKAQEEGKLPQPFCFD
ncbi:ribonuclease inhibitor-like [Carassius carassius]|uniref:ribonuclease inhibitor-like n=1 Tax=Carassius carassius TaxID=217509 RepID=UPI0028685BAD|nr:ribonuclease inhibitor-like [Carassius carassius]